MLIIVTGSVKEAQSTLYNKGTKLSLRAQGQVYFGK